MHPHDELIQPAATHTHNKKKRQGWREPVHKKYKTNKSMRTHATKEKHNNQDTTNALIK
jgi:hypothetical protein